MDIVIRTIEGDAEVSVASPVRERAVVADVVAAVTGGRCPPTVYVNGVPVAADRTLADAGVLAGSTVSTVAPLPQAEAVITLVQVAGPGAGATRRLHAGRFRLGPGRRMTADELTLAPVDRAVATLTVRPDGSVEVEGDAGRTRVWVEEQPLGERPLKWGEGMLLAGDRAFLHRPATAFGPDFGERSTVLAALLRDVSPEEVLDAPVAPDGTLAIPHEPGDAERSARWIGETPGARRYEAMLGVRHGTPGEGEVAGPGGSMTGIMCSLADSGGLGVVGSPDFTRSIARGIVLQLATRHAPSDLRFVVATTSEQLRAWEWMKWLPHARGIYGPLLFTTDAELRSWTASARHDVGLTLVLADDPTWWTGRDAALGPLLRQQDDAERSTDSAADPGAIARPIVMTGDASLLPAACTRTVTQRVDDHALFRAPGRDDEYGVPVLPPTWVAADAARRLAPYSDPDTGAARSGSTIDRPSLHDLLSSAAPAWARRGSTMPSWSIPIGLSRVGGWVSLDPVTEGPDLLIAGSGELAGTGPVTESIVLSAATMASPVDLSIVLIEVGGRDTFDRCAALPHVVTRLSSPSRHEARRFRRWLDGELASRRARLSELGVSTIAELDMSPFTRLFIVIDELVPVDPDLAVFADELARTVHDLGQLGVHLVVGTTQPAALAGHPAARSGTRIALRTATTDESELIIGAPDAAGLPRFVPGHAILRTEEMMVAFRPAGFATGMPDARSAAPTDAASARSARREPVAVVPYVVGREPSALEARLANRGDALPDRSADPYADHLVRAIRSAGRSLDLRARQPRWFPPLPDHLTVDALLASEDEPVSVRDRGGMPFGLADLPAEHDQRVLRWLPGHTSVALLGGTSEESGGALRAMLLAAASTVPADDLHLYLLGSTWRGQRSDASTSDVTELPHVGAVVADERAVVRLTRFLVEVVSTRRAATGRSRDPAIAVLIDGLDTFGATLSHRGQRALERLGDALVAGGPHGVCAVICSRRPGTATRRLIDRLGAIRVSLGAEVGLDAPDDAPPHVSELRPGRGVIALPDGVAELQLAMPPGDPAALIGRAVAMTPRRRPPVRLDREEFRRDHAR